MNDLQVMSGHLKTYDMAKGYGFIAQADTSKRDIFLHSSVLKRSGYIWIEPGMPMKGDVELTTDGRLVMVRLHRPEIGVHA